MRIGMDLVRPPAPSLSSPHQLLVKIYVNTHVHLASSYTGMVLAIHHVICHTTKLKKREKISVFSIVQQENTYIGMVLVRLAAQVPISKSLLQVNLSAQIHVAQESLFIGIAAAAPSVNTL